MVERAPDRLGLIQSSTVSLSGFPEAFAALGLQKQAASDASEKEIAKDDFSSLKSELEVHLGFLKSTISVGDADRLLMSVRAMDHAIRPRVQDVALGGVFSFDAVGGSRAYEVLRRSLDDSQRRCAMLNDDMMKVAETNDELMGTMNAVKSANRRLVEQIQKQTVEIDNLTQARVLDEEKVENLRLRHQQDQELWKQDAARQMETARRASNETYEKMRTRMTAKVHCIRSGLMDQRIVLGKHMESCKLLRGEFKSKLLDQWVGEQMRRVQRDVNGRIVGVLRSASEEAVSTDDRVHQLGVKLEAERDTRAQEERNWTQRLLILEGDYQEMERSKTQEIEQLNGQVESMHRSIDMEAEMQEIERQEMSDRLKVLRTGLATLEAKLSTTRTTKVCQETQCAKREAERSSDEEGIIQLRDQIKESDEALDRAVQSNEILRLEMENQRSAAQAQNEREIRNTTEAYKEKLAQLNQSHLDDTEHLEMQVRVLSEQITECAGEVQHLAAQVDALNADRSILQREMALWKAQQELAEKHHLETERDYIMCKEDWSHQRSDLDDTMDASQAKNKDLSADVAKVRDTIDVFVSEHRAKVADQSAYSAELAVKVREAEVLAGDTKKELQVRLQEFSSQKQEQAMFEARQAEELQEFDGQLELLKREETGFTQELEGALMQERRNAQTMMEQFARLREEHQVSLSQAQGEPQAKLALMERELADFVERTRRDVLEAASKVAAQDREIQAIEIELVRATEQLSETERTLTDETKQMKELRTSHLEAKGKLEQENRSLVEALESTKARHFATKAQLEERIRMGDADRSRLAQGLEIARLDLQKRLTSKEEEGERCRQEYESELRSRELFYQNEATRETHKLDTIIRENERLRQFVGEHRHQADTIENVGATMQAHINRMEQQTYEMRDRLGVV